MLIFMIETFKTQIDLNLEHITFNNIIVYNTLKVVTQIVSIINKSF